MTLLFECVLVPLALALPPQRRLLLALFSVALHAGIATVHSFLIGVAFLPNLGTYLLGFGAPVVVGSASSAGAAAAQSLPRQRARCTAAGQSVRRRYITKASTSPRRGWWKAPGRRPTVAKPMRSQSALARVLLATTRLYCMAR